MSSPSPGKKIPYWLIAIVTVPLLASIALMTWLYLRPPIPQDNLSAASEANLRGVGLMEQFEYAKAVADFEEAVKLAPGWSDARINLGIALLNDGGVDSQNRKPKLDRALAIFQEILAQHPDNPYAQYCAGIILYDRAKTEEALPHFEAVTRIDPNDAYAWFYRGKCRPNPSEEAEALDCFEKALKLNPYLNAARLAVAHHAKMANQPQQFDKLLADFEKLQQAEAGDQISLKYSEMGPYADVIGKSLLPPPALGIMPLFEPVKGLKVALSPGTSWVKPEQLSDLQRAVRTRFGGSVILFDYNRDGKPDILLLSAVFRDGQARDLLLRNDGNNQFSDVSQLLGNQPASFGGAVGDFDNDGYEDLVLAGPSGLKLLRNKTGESFEDRTNAAGLDKEPGVYLTACWLDLDQDGDLDLIAAKYAKSPELALQQIRGDKVDAQGGVEVFLNVGVAPPVEKGQPARPLSVAFKPFKEAEALLVKGPVSGIIASDIHGHRNLDLVVLVDGQQPVTVLNDRLLRFRRGQPLSPNSGHWNGGLVLDANSDDRPDLVLLDPASQPMIHLSKRADPGDEAPLKFGNGTTDSPPLRSATWVDLDLDGRTDLVGLSSDRKPIYLQGDGTGKFTRKSMPFGSEAEEIANLLAAVPVDLDGDGKPDLLCWSETLGLHLFRNMGNGNNSLSVKLTGMRDPGASMRTNAGGIGSWVRVYAGSLQTAAEATTLSAGPGQSHLPITFGIGKANSAEVVRIRWPDAVLQAEMNQPAGLVKIVETNRKGTSCPTLFLWDGERFTFLTDCLGAGSMGELEADGSTRKPRPEESIAIAPGKLVPRNGKYVIKVAEPMDEVMYLDKFRLDVIDHPVGLSVLPDERFATADPQPTQARLFFKDADRLFPVRAADHRGRDVTHLLRERDGQYVDHFAFRAWLGFAEDHWVALDFGDRLKSLPNGQRLFLILAGWTDYAFPESIFAAEQAGVPPVWPVLEQQQGDGSWKKCGEIGLPAGMPRVMTVDVSNMIDRRQGPIRIRANLQIFWDQIYLAPLASDFASNIRELPVSRASLEHRGFVQEFSPGGRSPISYDYDRLEPVPFTQWRGRLTRTGDVTELLTAEDDRFAIAGPGDEVTVEFDASSLPAVPSGYQRSFILRAWGYSKDTAPFTAMSSRIHPLPFKAMSNYPYDPRKEPLPSHVAEYDRKWNTRIVGKR